MFKKEYGLYPDVVENSMEKRNAKHKTVLQQSER